MQTNIPNGYTQAAGYPRGTRTEGADVLVDKLYKSFTAVSTSDLFTLEKLVFEKLIVNNISWERDSGTNTVYVTITYSNPNQSGVSRNTEEEEFFLDDSGQEIPIDKLKKDGSLYFANYKTIHNHHLVGIAGSAEPAWSTTATDTKISAGDSVTYRWIKDVADIREGEAIIKCKTKNIEAVLKPAPVIVGIMKFNTYTRAVKKMPTTGKLYIPEKTFGYSGDFLAISGISNDGKKWVVTTRYIQAEEWDSDYYAQG
jgi:hypothetical protein